MNTYRFAALPSNSSVATVVTFAACAWFLIAGGVMLTEKPGQPAAGAELSQAALPVVYAAPAVAIAPEARLIIVVEGRRA